MTPPYYYVHSMDEMLAHYRTVRQAIDLPLLIYNIPQTVKVKMEVGTTLKLAEEGTVVGIKDSWGEWNNTVALLKAFPGFEVFPGSETYLLDALRLGGTGCISATANVNVAAMRRLIDERTSPTAEARQAQLTAVRAAIQKYPLVSANKAILAQAQADPGWNVVRPPLRTLSAEAWNEVWNFEIFRDLQVQRNVSRKTSRPVARANKFQPFVYERERKA